jgi:ribosomal protein L7/L12
MNLNNSNELDGFLAAFEVVMSTAEVRDRIMRELVITQPETFMTLYRNAGPGKAIPKMGLTYEKARETGKHYLRWNGYEINVPFSILNRIYSYMQAGKKVEAIKELRSVSGMGLKESKDQVEAWEAEMDPSLRFRGSW